MSPRRAFWVLTREALADAVRRRIAPVVVVLALASLAVVDSCTSCSPTIEVNGELREIESAGAWLGLVLFVLLALWTAVLGGILAGDHLTTPLSDGTANLSLARPVSRATFAAARLAGVLLVTWGTGGVLLLGSASLLQLRHGLPLAPALGGLLACFGSSLVVASLAMAASLALPRAANALLVLGSVAVMAGVNALLLARPEFGGWLGALDQLGPPLASAVVLALEPWIAPVELDASPAGVTVRLLLWIGLGLGALLVAFSRRELGR